LRLLTLLVKQSKPNLWLGGIVNLYSGSSIYQTVVSAFFLSAVTYNTTIRETLVSILPWMNFWIFLCILIIGNLVLMVLHNKFVQPSIVAWSNRQGFKHDSPFRTLQESVDSKCDRILELLEGKKR